jgi:hypothetical protein
VINKSRQTIAAAQVLFRSRSVGSCLACQFVLFIGTQFEPQTFDDTLYDRVLDADDVAGFGVYSFTPENLAGANVEELCGYAEPIAGFQERRSENRIYVLF